MNAKVFKWSPDGWRDDRMPMYGLFDVQFPTGEQRTMILTRISDTHAVYQTSRADEPKLLPDGTRWACSHENFVLNLGDGTKPVAANCIQCGAEGSLLTPADFEGDTKDQ